MIVINFKNYKTGKEAMKLARLIEDYLGKQTIVCPATMDLDEIALETELKVFAQHVDNVEGSRATGLIVPKVLRKVGVVGSLLNHSEHRLDNRTIKRTLSLCKEAKLKVILCCESVAEARKFRPLNPWAIAFEDRELIGSGKSIVDYRSDEVRRFAEVFRKSKVHALCGAGINSVRDVKKSRELGCEGVLVASAIVKDEKGREFLNGLSKI